MFFSNLSEEVSFCSEQIKSHPFRMTFGRDSPLAAARAGAALTAHRAVIHFRTVLHPYSAAKKISHPLGWPLLAGFALTAVRAGAALTAHRAVIHFRTVLHPYSAAKKISHPFGWLFWQRNRDSNPNKQSQSLLCYLYTIPLYLLFYLSKRYSNIILIFLKMSIGFL